MSPTETLVCHKRRGRLSQVKMVVSCTVINKHTKGGFSAGGGVRSAGHPVRRAAWVLCIIVSQPTMQRPGHETHTGSLP
jgi:hypothetical protein